MLGRVSQAFEPKPISQLQLEREHGVSGAVRRRHRVAARRVREGRLQADRGVQGEQVHRQGGSGKGQSSRWRGAQNCPNLFCPTTGIRSRSTTLA